jgi:hypothetical protein
MNIFSARWYTVDSLVKKWRDTFAVHGVVRKPLHARLHRARRGA